MEMLKGAIASTY